jgi:predicted O-methyltransferase YrrM
MLYKTARGWLTDNEREAIVKYASDTRLEPRATIVNIGVEYGASLICLRQGAPIANIIGVDIDMSKNEARTAKLVKMDSGEFGKRWEYYTESREIDLLFVDGDHSYEGVVRDLVWTTYVRPAGYILFHDCYDWPPSPPKTVHKVCPGVNKAVEEWFQANAETVTEREHVDTMRIFRRIQ